jgi:hypothetical protein
MKGWDLALLMLYAEQDKIMLNGFKVEVKLCVSGRKESRI